MSAGTLKLTNGSTAVTGTGTTFTADMTVADVVVVTVGGTVYSLAVDSVTSDTALVLSLPFTGPTTTGVAWQAVPRKTMLRVTAELNKQVTEALRLSNENAINWQAVLSSPDTVNVLLPDGTTLTGFSWRKINDLLNALDVDHLDATATQIHTDAQQVGADKAAAAQSKTDAVAAKNAAVIAQGKSETAQAASETAKDAAVVAQGKSEAAQAKSETALAAAQAAASSVHPENLLHKDQNLDDLPDKGAARSHLDVYSKAETDGKGGGYIGQSWWHDMRSKMPDGCVASDGQEVDQAGPFADLHADVVAGNRPTCSEAEWQTDPTKRNCYVLNSSTGKMRLPDRNGVQPGSIKAPVMRGDGGALTAGSVQKGGVPNVAGQIDGMSARSAIIYQSAVVTPPFKLLPKNNIMGYGLIDGPNSTEIKTLGIDLSTSSDAYVAGLTEVRANSIPGCYVIRYAGRAQNAGSLDAMTLSARMESINTDLLAKNAATNARIDYALISGLTLANDGRQVIANPFGNNTPVDVQAELLFNDGNWYDTGWVLHYTSGSFGTRASYAQGVGIVLRGGRGGVYPSASDGGSGFPASAVPATPIQCRIHIRKITA